jgi:hypothetical protein
VCSVTVDFAANTLTAVWLPAIAKLVGQNTQTVSLATQPKRSTPRDGRAGTVTLERA